MAAAPVPAPEEQSPFPAAFAWWEALHWSWVRVGIGRVISGAGARVDPLVPEVGFRVEDRLLRFILRCPVILNGSGSSAPHFLWATRASCGAVPALSEIALSWDNALGSNSLRAAAISWPEAPGVEHGVECAPPEVRGRCVLPLSQLLRTWRGQGTPAHSILHFQFQRGQLEAVRVEIHATAGQL